MKVGYVLEQFPCFRDPYILNEILELEAQGVELEIYSLRIPGTEPKHEELAELQAKVTQISPLAPRSIRDHIKARRENGDTEAREDARLLSNRLEEESPWREDALALSIPLAEKTEAAGITHLHAHGCGLAAATAAETTRLTGIPYSFALHSCDLANPELTTELLTQRLREASFAVTECKAHAARVVQQCGRRTGSWIRVIYKGADLMRWNSKTEGKPLWDFVAVGPLEERKGFDIFLHAISLLKERGHSLRAAIVGGGPCERNLRMLSRRLDLDDSVDFMGARSHEEVRKVISRSTALVSPGIRTESGERDGVPTAVIEAMAMGVPPIASSIGGLPEIIEDPASGWLVKSGDSEGLARAMRKAMKLPNESERRGAGARRRAEAMLDLEAAISTLAKMMYRSSRRKVANQTRTEDFAIFPQ